MRDEEMRRKHREYMRAYRIANPGPRKKTQSRNCSLEDCFEPHYGLGLCYRHYANKYRREYTLNYLKAHPEIKRRGQRKRKARKRGIAVVTLTYQEWSQILEDFQYLCCYCGDPWEEQDHFIPLSKGGNHTADNVVPSCVPCNRGPGGKHDKMPLDWFNEK